MNIRKNLPNIPFWLYIITSCIAVDCYTNKQYLFGILFTILALGSFVISTIKVIQQRQQETGRQSNATMAAGL